MSEKLKILVVDDNEDFCRNVRDIPKLKYYVVVIADDGFKAFGLLEQNHFDLMLMYIKMPVMDGVETFKRMKKTAPDTPVIMITAYAVEELIREALREGAFGCLKKPLDFDKLFELIRQATDKGSLLLVADYEHMCSNIENILSDKGNPVTVAYNGDTAIQKTRENNCNIVFLDMKLPSLNGLEVYLSIRDIRPSVVVIISLLVT